VDVLHHAALVRRVLDGVPGAVVHPASPAVLAVLLEAVLAAIPRNPWAAFVAERPAALPGLLRALTDLREARLPPARVTAILGDGPDRALAQVYAGYVAALEERREAGLIDRAGQVERALPHVAAHAARYRVCYHHGAYELIGSHLALLRELDGVCETTFLTAVEPGARLTRYAERFAAVHLGTPQRLPERPAAASAAGGGLRWLYDEEARPRPLAPGVIAARHLQGARAEAQVALHAAVAAVAAGTPAPEIAIVARSLEPFAPSLEAALDGARSSGDGESVIPWSSSLSGPLRRDPDVRDLLLLLRVVDERFPRGPTAELLGASTVRWRALGLPAGPPAGAAESWSRRAGIVGGLEEWTSDLRDWAREGSDDEDDEARRRREARRRGVERIADAVRALVGRVRVSPATWSGHASRLEKLIVEVLPGTGDGCTGPGCTAMLGLLSEMRDLERLVGDRRRVPFREMLGWLDRAVDGTSLPLHPEDRGGIRVLDLMQARGLTFERVIWIGFQAGLFPRSAREDPYLPDRARRRLREATGCPLPLRGEADEEERLLLGLQLGAAGGGVELSWQRSDESGRPRSPSMALREIARIVLGRPAATELVEASARIRSHPRDQLEDLLDSRGLLSPADDLLLQALRSAGAGAEDEGLSRNRPDLAAGIRMLRATESLDPDVLRYDGRIGHALADPSPATSVSAFQRLGRCPLQFFFRSRLRIVPLEKEAGPFELAVREMGNRVHRILEVIFRRLQEDGALEGGVPRERVQALLDAAWDDPMRDLEARLGRRVPLLWSIEKERWRAALQAFLERDLPRLREARAVPEGLEVAREAAIPLGEGMELALRARLDRVIRTPRGLQVGDYKTAGNLRRPVSPTEMLRGLQLQVPLYHLMSGGGVVLLGVGPDFEDEPDRSTARFEGFESAAMADGFRETLRVLDRLRRSGVFPLRRDDRRCGWCDFRRACRRNHPPTRHREEMAADAADLRDLQSKSTRGERYRIADVRRGGSA
jgi:ATP-dependent helicase/nuclease subunit B